MVPAPEALEFIQNIFIIKVSIKILIMNFDAWNSEWRLQEIMLSFEIHIDECEEFLTNLFPNLSKICWDYVSLNLRLYLSRIRC